MKKFLQYIFIIGILTSTFVIPPYVQAKNELPTQGGGSDPAGTCVYLAPFGKAMIRQEAITTKAECDAKKPPGDWKEIPTQAQKPSPNSTTTDYEFLAPIKTSDGGGTGDTFNTTDPNSLGKYLNLMIRIFIGLAAVLAVVMIVMGGIEYMTSELVHTKEAGKERMTNALLGLLIALGAYALLYTINPDLLNTDIYIPATTIQYIEGESLADAIQSDSGPVPTGATTSCGVGIKKTTSGMFACGSIAQSVDNMIVASKQAGLNITGGGYRTPERQKELRIKYCKGDYKDPTAECSPPTALPGESRHNNGLAFDLKCDGVQIQTLDNKCYVWLKANASKFGLSNLSGEPWHWSTDGH